MAFYADNKLVEGLVTLANDVLDDQGVYLGNFITIEVTVFSESILYKILDVLKTKDVGTTEDFPRILPQKESFVLDDISVDESKYQRICLSKKYNSIVYYTSKRRYIDVLVITDIESAKKVKKKLRKVVEKDDSSSIFRPSEFDCEKSQFIEITESRDEKKIVDVVKRTIEEENLVFDTDSAIVEVIKDINTFFTKQTKELYKKLNIAYKRGVILYGEPGNGKSAMIREMIRTLDKVTTIIINPGIPNIIKVLQSVIKSLDGKPAIIVIEDIDSIITDYNRSELLNVLDGVDVKSGIFFIGTTNYYEKIDPAFMNRSGRFDRTYKIENPSDVTRRLYFESRGVEELFEDRNPSQGDIVSLFVKSSEGLPMANLKELITSVAYTLATTELTLKDAIEQVSETIKGNRDSHIQAHSTYLGRK